MRPNVDDLIVTLVVGDETHVVVVDHLLHFLVTFLHECFFLFRYDDVAKVKRQTSLKGHVVAQVLDTIQKVGRLGHTADLDDMTDDVAQRLLRNDGIDVSGFVGHDLVDNDTAHRSLMHHLLDDIAIFVHIVHQNADWGMNVALAFVVGYQCLFRAIEHKSLTLGPLAQFGYVVQAQHHVLSGHRDGRSVGRVQYVV